MLITGEQSKVNHEIAIIITIDQRISFVQKVVTILVLLYYCEELIKFEVELGLKITIY